MRKRLAKFIQTKLKDLAKPGRAEPRQGKPARGRRGRSVRDYLAHFDPLCGRPSTPIETYLRMMFLKHRHHLGYEVLCREVADSISWSRFCRIPFGAPVPHPTTLMKITTRCGEEAVEALNDTLLAKAARARVVKLDRARADTTVVEANVSYPTDCGLLAKAIGSIARLIERIHAADGATRTKVRDRRRAARRRARSIAAHFKLRGDDAKAAVRSITAELATLAETADAEAQGVVANARRKLAREGVQASGKLASLVAELETTMARASPGGVPDPHPSERDDPRRRHPPGVAARPRRPPHRQGAPRPPRGARLQGAGSPQRRRHRLGQPGDRGQPPRRPPARPRCRPDQGAGRQGPESGRRRPGLRGGFR